MCIFILAELSFLYLKYRLFSDYYLTFFFQVPKKVLRFILLSIVSPLLLNEDMVDRVSRHHALSLTHQRHVITFFPFSTSPLIHVMSSWSVAPKRLSSTSTQHLEPCCNAQWHHPAPPKWRRLHPSHPRQTHKNRRTCCHRWPHRSGEGGVVHDDSVVDGDWVVVVVCA